MTVIATKNLGIFIEKKAATPLSMVPTGITNADPAVVTVADTTGATMGDVVEFAGTGEAMLDGKRFLVGAVTATTFEAVGADLTSLGGPITPPGTATATVHIATDLVRVCAADFQVSAPSVSEVDIGTYCAEGTMPGQVTPGTISIAGNVEKGDNGFDELEGADSDGLPRLIKIVPGGNNGAWVGEIIVSGLGYTFPRNDRIQYTFNGSQTKLIEWIR